MLASELPINAAPHPTLPHVWDDPTTRTHYYLDPHDASIVVTREWTAGEVAEENQRAAVRQQNAELARRDASSGLDALIALIGPAAATAKPGDDSINELLAIDNATINANPARHIKILARLLRLTLKAVVVALRIAAGRFESTSTGN